MASYTKTSTGYRSFIKVSSLRETKTFPTKREAVEWAIQRELELKNDNDKPLGEKFTLRDDLRKYANEISPTKRGCRWEQIRLAAFEERRLPLDTTIAQVGSKYSGNTSNIH